MISIYAVFMNIIILAVICAVFDTTPDELRTGATEVLINLWYIWIPPTAIMLVAVAIY